MTFKQIAELIGNRTWLRTLAYRVIHLTTLREWYIRRSLKTLLGKNKVFTFLDAGTGLGQHAVYIAKRFPHADVLGLEADAALAKSNMHYALKSNIDNLVFKQADLLNYSFSARFDVILCASVLEHITDDEKVLNEFYKALHKKGYVVIYVPVSEQRTLRSLNRKINKIAKASSTGLPHGHVRYYSENELTAKLTNAGFTLVGVTIASGFFGRLSYDIVTSVQYSRLFKIIFPFYLLLIHPFVLLLMWADYRSNNESGNGLLIIAQK